jgi:hypothetical protein
MIEYLPATAAAVLTPLITLALARSLRQSNPLQGDEKAGTIRPERWSAALTVGIGAIICIGGIAAMAFAGGLPQIGLGIMLFLMGGMMGGFMAPSLTSVHAVHWTESGIEGPSKTFGPTLGTQRTEIRWDDIVASGKTPTSYWFIQSTDNRRVYWSYLYKGHGALTAALRANCPDLTLPNDMG